jgi:hypothetical protein
MALALVFALVTGCGITAPRSNEGYANLDALGMLDVERTTAISLGPTVLNFAARHMDDDEEIRALLRSLDGVRVRIYEIDGDADRVAERMDQMSVKLGDDDWQPVATIQEEGERTYMLMKMVEDRVAGLTVISSDGAEAVVVNIMGDLQPALFSDTMAALDVDVAPQVQVAVIEQPLTDS